METTFASFWLSRAALVAMALYLYSAVRIWGMAPGIRANRLAALLCFDLAAWALFATVSYSTADPGLTVALSRAFSWTWPMFPVLGLHLVLEATDPDHTKKRRWRRPVLVATYSGAILCYLLLAGPLLRGAVHRAGYWSVDIAPGAGFWFFSIFYLVVSCVTLVLEFMGWKDGRTRRERTRMGILFVTHAVALAGGFTNDTVLASLGFAVPKVGILWAVVWAVGLHITMDRYGFLSPFSPRVAGLLMDRFVERSMDGIVVCDDEGTILYWNRPLAGMTGIPASDALGHSLVATGLVPSGTAASTASGNGGWRGLYEYEFRRHDGETRYLHISRFVIPGDDGDVHAMILRDMTADRLATRNAMENLASQSRSQKMEALGSLAGGIAHDFNNTLGGIVGALSLIRARHETEGPGADISREIDVIDRSSRRAAASVRELLTFAADVPVRKEPYSIADAIRSVASLAGKALSPSVRLKLDALDESAMTVGDQPQAEQMLLNLVINAEHAMTIMLPPDRSQGGDIVISLRAGHPGHDRAGMNLPAQTDRYWCVAVSDEGIGIDPATLTRIFNPYYTTKGADRGSGLGLAMAQLIAEQHGGCIQVDSTPGEGSVFRVWLPAVPDDVTHPVAPAAPDYATRSIAPPTSGLAGQVGSATVAGATVPGEEPA